MEIYTYFKGDNYIITFTSSYSQTFTHSIKKNHNICMFAVADIYIESLMSCHLLLNLLHSLAKMILCSAEPRIISCLPTHVIHLVINDNEFEILFIT